MPITSPGNDDDTGENHQPTLRKNTAEPVEQTLKQNNYVGRHTVRDRCHIAVCEVNTGMMDDGWDDPRLYRRRVKWEC